MNKVSLNKKNIFIVIIMMCGFIDGCANHTNPDNLKLPDKISCIKLDSPISYSQNRKCLICASNEVRLEKGLYISEKTDESGVYYRAPAAGIYHGLVDAQKFSNMGYDGGIYVPFDSSVLPRVYIYTTTGGSLNPEPAVAPDENLTCESLRYVKDPSTQKFSIVQFASAGAIGGAVGASLNKSGSISGTTGAAGGLIAGAIIASIENMEIGKIFFLQESDEYAFKKIKFVSSKPYYIKEKND